MLNRILQNHWCRFVAGNLSVALLVIGIPVAILFMVTQTLTSMSACLLILAIVHISLVGLQISQQGTWVPEKWLAAGYVVLPVIDVSRTVSWFSRGFWLHGFWAFVLAVVASFFTVSIVQNQWRKWRMPKSARISSGGRTAADHHDHFPTDDPTTMVY